MSTQQTIQTKQKNYQEIYYLMVDQDLEQLDVYTFLEQMFQEQSIQFQLSQKIFKNSILWLQAKPIDQNEEEKEIEQCFNDQRRFKFKNEFMIIYHNSYTFQRDYLSGDLFKEMHCIQQFKQAKDKNKDFKVIILFNSVSDSLYNNEQNPFLKSQLIQSGLKKQEFDDFLIQLTIKYEFDYREFYSFFEIIDFLKEMHISIMDKPHRKELSMYSKKGFKPGKKAILNGFKDELSLAYISFLMQIPGLSENKAIAIAKVFPSLKSLFDMLTEKEVTEKDKKKKIQDIEVQHTIGEKSKKIGKVLSDRIYKVFVSTNPDQIIN